MYHWIFQAEEDMVGRDISMNGGNRTAYTLLIGKPEEKRPLGTQKCRWVDNIKMNLVEI
jgi:hypothetical protein